MQVFMGVSGLLSLAMYVTVVVTAFMDRLTAGLLCMLCGPYFLYWLFLECENSLVKQLWCVGFVGAILTYFGLQYLPGGGP